MTRTIIDHEQRFYEVFDHAAGRMHVDGASREPSAFDLAERDAVLRRVVPEWYARELVEALKAAVANAPGWQFEAQMLLRRIAAGEPKEPTP